MQAVADRAGVHGLVRDAGISAPIGVAWVERSEDGRRSRRLHARPAGRGSVMRPRVSIVLPVHDREAFVARAAASLLAQGYHDWELVVVDDGSTDGTVAALADTLIDH